jgi:membrane protease YdiL (CAAX protease family)
MLHSNEAAAPRTIDWVLVLILLTGGLIGAASTIPLLIEWLPLVIGTEDGAELQRNLPLPIPVLLLLSVLQNGLLLGGAIVAGVALSGRMNRRFEGQLRLGAVEFEAWRRRVPHPGVARRFAVAAAIGLATGLLLVALDAFILLPRTGVELAGRLADAPLWKRLLTGLLYGGITEELLTRLFLVTVLIWALGKLWKGSGGQPANGAIWMAIVVASLLFAAGHLPMASRLADLTPWLLMRVLVLNGVAGVVYGWLYVRRGLEAAMIAHAATHIPLQTLARWAVQVAASG